MEFGLSGVILLACSSLANCEPVRDQVRGISTCRDSSNLSATGRKSGVRPGGRPASELASRIAHDRRNSITYAVQLASSSLVGR